MTLDQNPLKNLLLQLVLGWPTFRDKMPGLQTPYRLSFLTLLTGYCLVQTALDIICLSVSFCYEKIGKLNLKNMNRRGKFLKKLCAASAGRVTRQFGADLLRRRASSRNVSFRISLRWPIHIINPVDK